MTDIAETLEDGVYMIVYADDILVYAIDSEDDRARRKLSNTLDRIKTWCQANELSIAPDKSAAINFSRCRDTGPLLRFAGVDLPWSHMIKFLGIWFTRSLSFSPHFHTIKAKALKRISYLKFITSKTRGVTSFHMIRLINTIVRSCLEYGAPVFFDSPPTSLKTLETCYNSAIRLATGLPIWTPLPVLRREAGVPSMTSRLLHLTRLFLIRLLSSPSGIRLGEEARSSLSISAVDWKWWNPLQSISCFDQDVLSKIQVFSWPPPPCSLRLKISINDFDFQDPSLPDNTLVAAWKNWFHSLTCCSAFATDASKDQWKTSIAAIDIYNKISVAGLVPHSNSVFTAEALAIQLALTSLPINSSIVLILTDSLSVLRALDSWSFRSHTMILKTLNIVSNLNKKGILVHLVWCPSHRGIPPNEEVDQVAKHGPFTQIVQRTSSEDFSQLENRSWREEINYEWLNSDYAHKFPHLHADRLFCQWISTRSLDVTLARWRSRTILTSQKLFHMKLVCSPICNFCFDHDSPEHILLHCPRLNGPRRTLFQRLGLHPPVTYSDVLDAAFSSMRSLIHFICFSRLALPQSH